MSPRPVVFAILVLSFGLCLPAFAWSQDASEEDAQDEAVADDPEEEPAPDEATAEEPADEPAEGPAAEEAAAAEEPAPAVSPEPASTAGRDEQEDKTRYKVVMNHEEQYSIWPADKENALGWRDAGKSGTKQECLDYIKQVWTDMRPLSLRRKMEEAAKEKDKQP